MSATARLLACAAAMVAAVCASGTAYAGARAKPVAVLPPARPVALAVRGADVTTTGSIRLAAEEGAPAPAAEPRRLGGSAPVEKAAGDKPPLTEKAAVDRANAALNAITSMSADFTQIGGDGRQSSGILYLQRPGKVRFEYNKPSTMEVVSDGSTVLVRDRKLNTAEPYPIGQTPLKFLLDTKVELGRDVAVKKVATEPGGVAISIEDSSTIGGTSKITLGFDPDLTVLKRWRVVDPQGYTTVVTLSDIERNHTIDPHIFMLNYMRPVE